MPRRRRRSSARNATLLGGATSDPYHPVVAGQRPRGAIGVGGLAVVDPVHASDVGDPLLAVRQPGIASNTGGNRGVRDAECARQRRGSGDVLRIVQAWKIGRNGDRRVMIRDLDAVSRARLHGARQVVVDADHCRVQIGLAREDLPLGLGITVHVAVSVDVVGAEVEHCGSIEAQCGESLQHVAGHL